MSWPPQSQGPPPPDSPEEGSPPESVEGDRLPSSSLVVASSSPSSSSLLPLLPSATDVSKASKVQEQPLNLESRTPLRTKALSSSSSLDIEYRPYPPTRPRLHSTSTSTSSLTITAVRGAPIPSPRLYRLPPDHSSQTHFKQGSLIQLASGGMKKVEDLQTDDFINSAATSTDVSLDQSTLLKVEVEKGSNSAVLGFEVGREKLQVSVSAGLEHPFFVFGRGWASCDPHISMTKYSLACSQLVPGDVCISLAHADKHHQTAGHGAKVNQQQQGGDQQKSNLGPRQGHLGQEGATRPRSGSRVAISVNNGTVNNPSRLPPSLQTAKADS